MKVAIVHDDLVQWGGAERVLLGIMDIFPNATLYTSLYNEDNFILSQAFGSKMIVTSFLQKLPGWKRLYKALLPFYPLAFEQFDFSGYDLVISHTTRFAKCIITKPKTLHICYCHTPPRFLWHFSYNLNSSFIQPYLSGLRIYDQITSSRVDHFVAGSKNAQNRIKKTYGLKSRLVYPFIDLERFRNIESFDGGYFVVIARSAKYKRIDLATKACLLLGLPLKIIGGGNLDDEMVIQVLAGCKALIIAAEEDFGLVSLEAQALGKPVIAYAKGGALETVIPDKTGILFDKQSTEGLISAIKKLDTIHIDPRDCIENAACFSKENFINKFKATVEEVLYTK